MKFDEWEAKRGEILERHTRDIERLFDEVERLQKKVVNVQQIHKLELQMWDNSKPRTWKGFGLGFGV